MKSRHETRVLSASCYCWRIHPAAAGQSSPIVVRGEITYRANGEELEARSGSFVLIPRDTVHSFRVDSETVTFLNSYTPAGFERTITELAEPAQACEIPPSDRLAIPAGFDKETEAPRVIAVVEAESMEPFGQIRMDWGDMFEIEIFPVVTAEQGLELARQAMASRQG